MVPVMEDRPKTRLLASSVHGDSGAIAEFVTSWDEGGLRARFDGSGGTGGDVGIDASTTAGTTGGSSRTAGPIDVSLLSRLRRADGARGLVLQSHWASRIRRDAAALGYGHVRFAANNEHLV